LSVQECPAAQEGVCARGLGRLSVTDSLGVMGTNARSSVPGRPSDPVPRPDLSRVPSCSAVASQTNWEKLYTPGALVLARVGQIGPMITTHRAGKMKIASGKMSFSCS